MFCRKCGNELKEGVKFCTKCGNPVAPTGQTGLEVKKIQHVQVGQNDNGQQEQKIDRTVYLDGNQITDKDNTNQNIERRDKSKPDRIKQEGSSKKEAATRKKAVAGKPVRKNDSNRLLTIIMIIVLVVALLVAAAATVYLLKPEWLGMDGNGKANTHIEDDGDDEDDSEDDDEPEDDDDSDDEDSGTEKPTDDDKATPTPTPTPTPEPTPEPVVYEDWDLDIGEECKWVKSMCNDYDNNLGHYKKVTLADGDIIAYVQNGTPVKIIVKKGYNGWNYNREYYGVDAFYTKIYDDTGTRELYYSGGRLCRLIDEKGAVHDYNSADWAEYDEVGVKASEDKTEIKDLVLNNL